VTLGYLLLALGVVAGFWQWRKFQHRATCRRLAALIQSMRQKSLGDARFAPVDARDPRDHRVRRVYADISRELGESGLKALGDVFEERDDGSVGGVVSWFRTDDGLVCGWFGIAHYRPVMLLFSESAAGDYYITGRGSPEPSLARPPVVHRAGGEWGEGAPRALQRHRALAGTNASDLHKVATLDDAVALLQRLRTTVAQWRQAQPQEALLEADLRATLGRHYDRFAADVRHILTSPGSRAA
jgi:hypothetical protein